MIGDWPQIKNRFCALWEREIINRCCVRVVSQKKGCQWKPEPFPSSDKDRQDYWLDGERILKRELERIDNTHFTGDAFPQIFSNFGAAGHAAYFKNVHVDFGESIWMHPKNEGLPSDEIDVQFDPNSLMYKKTYEVISFLANESNGRYFVSMPDISGNIDALAHIRGNDTLLMDLVANSDNVKSALKKISAVNLQVTKDVFELTKTCNDDGSTIGWLDTWAPGLHSQMQSDISVMISPKMFKEFSLPELQLQSNMLEYPLYHLDGQEQIRHLDLLLSIEKLKMIQWTNVAGQASPVEFINVFKKIQQAGKCLLIKLDHPNEIEPIMTELSSKGLYIHFNGMLDSEEQAKDVVKLVEKLTHD